MYIVKSSGGRVVSTLASHAIGPGFKPRAGHVFLFFSNAKKSDKNLATGYANKEVTSYFHVDFRQAYFI